MDIYQYFNAYSNKNAYLKIPKSQTLFSPACTKDVFHGRKSGSQGMSLAHFSQSPMAPSEHIAPFSADEFTTAVRASHTAYRHWQVVVLLCHVAVYTV